MGAALREELGVKLAPKIDIRLHGDIDGMHHILLSESNHCLNLPPDPRLLVIGWHKVLMYSRRESLSYTNECI